MVLPFNDRYKRYDPVVPTTEFIVDFPVFDDDDLSVFVASEETVAFTVDSTYVFGVSNSTTIILNSAVTNVSVEIYGSRQPARGSKFLGNSPLFPGNIQRDMDAITAVQQEMYRDHAAILLEQEDLQSQINGLDGDLFYTARQDIVDDLGTVLKNLPEGREVRIPGFAWVKMLPSHPLYGTNPIPDMPGYFAAGEVLPGHFSPATVLSVYAPFVFASRDVVSVIDVVRPQSLRDAILANETDGSDASDITPFVQEAAKYASSNARALMIPAGAYFLDEQVSVADAITIKGDGPGNSRLTWVSGAASEGIDITSGSTPRSISIEGIGLYTEKQGVGDALTITQTAGMTATNRTIPRVNIRDVYTVGATRSGVDGWANGLSIIDGVLMVVDNFKHAGYLISPSGAYVGTAIDISGSEDPAQVFLSNLNLTTCAIGLNVSDCEGIYMHHFEMPTVERGVVVDSAAGEPGVMITDGHINATIRNIDLTNVTQYRISKIINYLRQPTVTPGSMVKVNSGCEGGEIFGNIYTYSNSGAEIVAVEVDGGSWCDIHNEQFDCGTGGRAIKIGASAVNTDVGNNRYISGNRVTNNSSTATFAEYFAYSGSLNNIAISSRRSRQLHHLITGASNLPGGESATGASVETFSQSSTTGMQTFYSGTTDALYRRRYVSGAWQPWAAV